MKFINKYSDDKEWTAHVDVLNDMKNPLGHIVQYTRSDKHFPAHMHIDLLQQWQIHLAMKARLDEQEIHAMRPNVGRIAKIRILLGE